MTELHESAGPGPGDAHFAVFPDREDAAAVARSFLRPGSRTLSHPTGRPWLVGDWHDSEIVTATAGRAALAVVGCCPVDSAELERRARPRCRRADAGPARAAARRAAGCPVRLR
jgi:asparagine synthase (glutamine-hydrolysing)